MILHFPTLEGVSKVEYSISVANGPRARAYISGKSLVPMLHLLHMGAMELIILVAVFEPRRHLLIYVVKFLFLSLQVDK